MELKKAYRISKSYIGKLLEDEYFTKTILVFLLVKFIVIVVGISSYVIIPEEMTNRQIRANNIFLDPWAQYDSDVYISIAKIGYSGPLETGGNYGWFPLYSFVVRIFSFLGFYTSAFLVSNLSSIIGISLLYILVKSELDRKLAYRTAFFVTLFPTSYFFVAMYTESLFFMFSIAVFVLARGKNYFWASVAGFFLALTRMQGILILLPLIYIYMRDINFNSKKIGREIFYFLLIPLAIIVLLSYHLYLTGDPFIQFKTQSNYERKVSFPWVSIESETSRLIDSFNLGFQRVFVHSFNIFITAFLLFFTYLSFRYLGKEYALYALLSILMPMSSGILESIARFALVIFPIFMSMAVLEKKNKSAARAIKVLYTIFPILLILFTIRHANEEIFFDIGDAVKAIKEILPL